MSYQIVWTDRALSRLQEIGDHIAEENPAAARRVVERLLDRVAMLAEVPRSGPAYAEASEPELREVNVGKHRVIYRVIEASEQIDILTVRHGRQRLLASSRAGRCHARSRCGPVLVGLATSKLNQ